MIRLTNNHNAKLFAINPFLPPVSDPTTRVGAGFIIEMLHKLGD